MKYHKLDNHKLMLNLEKPFSKMIYNNQNKLKYNLDINFLNTKNYPNNNKNIYTPIKTYNYHIDKKNKILKTTPFKYQYRKIPFEKVKGFKFKLPNNIILKQQKKMKTNINYPIICTHNNSTIQSNMNTIKDTLKNKMETINHQDDIYLKMKNDDNKNINKEILIYNKIKKPIYHQIIETKSSSIGSKYETRDESAHFQRSKSSINNIQLIKKEKEKNIIKHFSFLKFDKKRDKINLSPNKKILKYINKAIKQLNKIKILITDKSKKRENLSVINSRTNLQNKNIRIDLSKIGKNLQKYKNIIDIDNNKINLSFERNNQTIGINNNIDYIMNKKKKKTAFKKLNRTITYDELKTNNKKGHRTFHINKIEYMNKYGTINNEDKFRIKNSDTEIKIPKIDINYIKKMKKEKDLYLIKDDEKELNNKKYLKDRYKTENDRESIFYNDDGENINNNTDIANFEFSD